MAGQLRTAANKAEIVVTLSEQRFEIQSPRVLSPAWQLFKLRRALRKTNAPLPALPVRLTLGRLPTITLSL